MEMEEYEGERVWGEAEVLVLVGKMLDVGCVTWPPVANLHKVSNFPEDRPNHLHNE